jgi:alpha-beta hydrolase superfamily lysophospholipase
LPKVDVVRLRSEYSGPHELLKTSDGKTLFIRAWKSKGEARAALLIFHGITAYSGPYGPLIAEHLAASGFDVFGLDLRGHGLSDGKRGDYPSRERFVEDLGSAVSLAKSKSRKLVLLGHSLGALAAIAAVNSKPESVDGVVLLSAARKIRTGVYPKPKAAALLKTLFGVAFFRGTPVIEYRRSGQLGLDDPLFDFKYSARFYTVLYGAGALAVTRMMRTGLVDSPNLKFSRKLAVPLILGVGDQDELFTPEAVKEFHDEIECDDKRYFVVPGAHHAAWPKDSWGPLDEWLRTKF